MTFPPLHIKYSAINSVFVLLCLSSRYNNMHREREREREREKKHFGLHQFALTDHSRLLSSWPNKAHKRAVYLPWLAYLAAIFRSASPHLGGNMLDNSLRISYE